MELICIGDSLTFGFKMTRENSWPQIVGKNLEIKVKTRVFVEIPRQGCYQIWAGCCGGKPTYVLIMGGSMTDVSISSL